METGTWQAMTTSFREATDQEHRVNAAMVKCVKSAVSDV